MASQRVVAGADTYRINSPRAVQVSIGIVRVFVKLRAILSTHHELACRLDELERKFEKHHSELHYVFEAFRELYGARTSASEAPHRIRRWRGE